MNTLKIKVKFLNICRTSIFYEIYCFAVSERFLKKKHYDLYIKVHLIAFAMGVIRRVIAISHPAVSTAY